MGGHGNLEPICSHHRCHWELWEKRLCMQLRATLQTQNVPGREKSKQPRLEMQGSSQQRLALGQGWPCLAGRGEVWHPGRSTMLGWPLGALKSWRGI